MGSDLGGGPILSAGADRLEHSYVCDAVLLQNETGTVKPELPKTRPPLHALNHKP